MTTYQHARRGGGSKVHAIGPNGQLCGAGMGRSAPRTGGIHRPSRLHLTDRPVDCAACLKAIAKAQGN